GARASRNRARNRADGGEREVARGAVQMGGRDGYEGPRDEEVHRELKQSVDRLEDEGQPVRARDPEVTPDNRLNDARTGESEDRLVAHSDERPLRRGWRSRAPHLGAAPVHSRNGRMRRYRGSGSAHPRGAAAAPREEHAQTTVAGSSRSNSGRRAGRG